MNLSFKYKKVLLGFVIVMTAVQVYFLSRLRFDYDIAQLFPKNDPELAFHREAERKFAFNQPYLILGIENRAGIFNDHFLKRLDRLIHEIELHDLVRSVNAPTNIRNFQFTPVGKIEPRFIHVGNAGFYERDSLRLSRYPDVSAKFLSTKHTAVCNYIQLKEELTAETKENFQTFLEEKITEGRFDRYYLYGDAFVKDSYMEELKEELYSLSGLSLLLIFVILFATFRSVWGIVIPMIIVVLSSVWTLGTMSMFRTPLNLMTVLIPTLISVIALSDVIHVMSRFREHPHTHISKREAIILALRDIRLALFLTSATTALGFLTLTYSNIQPFIEFGLYTAIGVAYAFLLAILFLPLLMDWLPVGQAREEQPYFSHLIAAVHRLTRRRKKAILIASLFIFLLSVAGMTRLRVDAYLYEELSAKDEFSQTLRFFEEHFSGIRTFELYVQAVDTARTILDADVLRQMDRIENYLLEEYGLNETYSFLTQIKRINRAYRGGDPAQFVLPASDQTLAYYARMVNDRYDDFALASVLTRDQMEARIRGKIYDFGSAEIRKRNRRLQAFLDENIDPGVVGVKLTGSTLLLDKSNEIITRNLMYGLLFAIMVVALIMGTLYRSWKITLIALLPNLLPLVMILGIIGWADMGLKMSTAIIFTIAFGIAVDDTLHFMSRLKSELNAGYFLEDAVRATFLSAGKAIVVTSVVLILGFGILLFSSFHTTFMTGLLVSLALLFALFADLLLLPVLLVTFWGAIGQKAELAPEVMEV